MPIQIYWKFHHQELKVFQTKKKFYIFHISAQNIDCGYSLEPPCQGGSNEYPQYMFWAEIRKLSEFSSENFQFMVVNFFQYIE